MEDFLRILEAKYKNDLHDFLYGKRSYKPAMDELFNKLLIRLHRQEVRISNYLSKTEKKKKLLYSEFNDKFRIDFVIFSDNTSKLKMTYYEKFERDFQPNFIESKLKDNIYYVYFIKSDYGYKIGKTKNINNRLKTFDVKLPFDFELYSYIETKAMDDCESWFHELLKEKRINGEWFDLNEYDFIEIERLANNWGQYKLKQ